MAIERVTVETATRTGTSWREPTIEEREQLPSKLRSRVEDYMREFKRVSKVAKQLRVELLDEWDGLSVNVINGRVLVAETSVRVIDDNEDVSF